ncbi:hypothetical protein ERICI_00766 [Paenibacillus larvae subsp. larvae]|uniref:Uncharacterized protein n=1 Tax=Paenibacillus larvae subsp. larvae TaxID=147375 RepID=A0A6C0QPT4_9BACL|nr:hypothetical protein ERICI_00766 [Paenibacillus larvae subsp. larvae]ETK28356.1 hypothetical protein ERIC1_1c18180 [Paenibacillus larvae subsp. larvae DSM 25719]QHZ50246.1 hypothetical protein ERICV_01073 [Paenibacillus larvae subsp. larvae]
MNYKKQEKKLIILCFVVAAVLFYAFLKRAIPFFSYLGNHNHD